MNLGQTFGGRSFSSAGSLPGVIKPTQSAVLPRKHPVSQLGTAVAQPRNSLRNTPAPPPELSSPAQPSEIVLLKQKLGQARTRAAEADRAEEALEDMVTGLRQLEESHRLEKAELEARAAKIIEAQRALEADLQRAREREGAVKSEMENVIKTFIGGVVSAKSGNALTLDDEDELDFSDDLPTPPKDSAAARLLEFAKSLSPTLEKPEVAPLVVEPADEPASDEVALINRIGILENESTRLRGVDAAYQRLLEVAQSFAAGVHDIECLALKRYGEGALKKETSPSEGSEPLEGKYEEEVAAVAKARERLLRIAHPMLGLPTYEEVQTAIKRGDALREERDAAIAARNSAIAEKNKYRAALEALEGGRTVADHIASLDQRGLRHADAVATAFTELEADGEAMTAWVAECIASLLDDAMSTKRALAVAQERIEESMCNVVTLSSNLNNDVQVPTLDEAESFGLPTECVKAAQSDVPEVVRRSRPSSRRLTNPVRSVEIPSTPPPKSPQSVSPLDLAPIDIPVETPASLAEPVNEIFEPADTISMEPETPRTAQVVDIEPQSTDRVPTPIKEVETFSSSAPPTATVPFSAFNFDTTEVHDDDMAVDDLLAF